MIPGVTCRQENKCGPRSLGNSCSHQVIKPNLYVLHGRIDSAGIIKPINSNSKVSERETQLHAGQIEFHHLPTGVPQDLVLVLRQYLLTLWAQLLNLMAFLITARLMTHSFSSTSRYFLDSLEAQKVLSSSLSFQGPLLLHWLYCSFPSNIVGCLFWPEAPPKITSWISQMSALMERTIMRIAWQQQV